ncbi:MAG TPA: aminoglycoside phosphotransferase family protein [Solirubrobacteraceae bacterium]|jgi:Ser/Thr protein kinase RdoA (MazF antagonist)
MSRTDARVGVKQLPGHLAQVHGIEVGGLDELDLGVYRVNREDGPSWIARVFPAERPFAQAEGDTEILRLLAELDYPAERVAVEEPLSELHGQAVLVTELVQDVLRRDRRAAIRAARGIVAIGELLGRLQTLPSLDGGAAVRPGGSWHHLADGGPRAELAALAELLDEAEGRVKPGEEKLYKSLRKATAGLDDGSGLRESFVHPDFALANILAPPAGGLVLIDWAGAGQAPRMTSLAFALWAIAYGRDLARVDRLLAGYRRHVEPEPDELKRLGALIEVRPLIFDAWAFATGRKPLAEAARGVNGARRLAASIAARAREAFTA